MDEKQALQVLNYTISVGEYERAFIAFQKRYVFPKNYIMTVLFAGIIVLYAQQIKTDPSYTMAWVLLAVCIAFIILIWYNVFRIRKSLVNSIKEIQDDKYTSTFFEDGLMIQTEITGTDETQEAMEIQPKRIYYELDSPDVLENSEIFILYLKKQMFYVLPKRSMNDREIEFLRTEFSEKLEKKFIQTTKS